MKFKPIRFIPESAGIHFMRAARYGFIGSSILIVVTIIIYFAIGVNLGIDFRGGTLIEIRTAAPADLSVLREQLGALELGSGVELQEFGAPTDVLIRLPTQNDEKAQQAAVEKVRQALGPGIDYRRIETVGPKVSGELARGGVIAVVVAILLVMIYLWFRFEWQFAVGAAASLVHDVALTIGLFVVLQLDFDLSIIAAILTIVGYSWNDTVVVYDRVRENLRRYKQLPLPDLIDLSLNETLPRTIMTSLSVLLALLSLYFFGGEVIRGFTFTMIWGVIVGTYSSIYIAAPFLIFTGVSTGGQTDRAKTTATPEAARP
jgi:preprotein translocase subunit SecF